MKAVHRESEDEQQTLGFLFKSFRPSNEVIHFHRIPYQVYVCAGICIWIGYGILGFLTRKCQVFETGCETGDSVLVPLFWSGSMV